MSILVVVWVKGSFGGVCRTKYTKYQCHKIPMTTYAPYRVAEVYATLAHNTKVDEYFGCDVCSGHFAVTNKAWRGLMGRRLRTENWASILVVVWTDYFVVINKHSRASWDAD